MNTKHENYKIYQLQAFFVSKYKYEQLLFKNYINLMEEETFLFNFKNKDYQLIRLTTSKPGITEQDRIRIDDYIQYCVNKLKKNINFIDIHVCKEEYDEKDEYYKHCCIENNYYAGVELESAYPDIKKVVHNVHDPKKEMNELMDVIYAKEAKKGKNPFAKNLFEEHYYTYTYITMGICALMFILTFLLSSKVDQTSAYLILGADYKTLTLGCKEYWRLFTYAFLHSGFPHFFCNMVSLYYLGKYTEYAHFHHGYIFILIAGIICGSLTQGILADNQLCIGISGGIYGMFIGYLIDIYRMRVYETKRLILTIVLNIMLNFLSSTAWMCHLGGAIGGFAAHFAVTHLRDKKAVALPFILILCLIIKYVTIGSINTFYGGTDIAYVEALNSLNINTDSIVTNITNAYIKYGGK